jgi:hypothetical protein
MARTLIPTKTLPLHGATTTDISWTAASAADDHYFVNTGGEILLAKNNDSGSHVATLVSVADPYGRTGDETITVAAGALKALGPFPPELWNQSGSQNIHLDIGTDEDTSVSFAVLRIQR